MKHRILVLGTCLLLAACSTGASKTVIGAGPPSQPPLTTPSHHPIPQLTAPSDARWSRTTGIDNNPPQLDRLEWCENSYSNPYRTGWVTICAGGKRDDVGNFTQAALWVDVNPDPRQSGPGSSPPPDSPVIEYDAPNSPTWVKIVSVTGDIVSLQNQGGITLTFNLAISKYM